MTTGGGLRYIDACAETGTSAAVVVEADTPIAHTTQMFPVDERGELVAADDLRPQLDAVMAGISNVLSRAQTGLDNLVRLNVNLARDADSDSVREYLAERFPGEHKSAATFVTGGLALDGALVAMDAFAAVPKRDPTYTGRVAFLPSVGSGTIGGGASVGVMPPGPKAYLSGQASGTAGASSGAMKDATQGTMRSLHATLAWIGLTARDVVQLKSFHNSIGETELIAATIEEYYLGKPSPPLVSVEWTDASFLTYLDEATVPVEIELHAARGPHWTPPATDEVLSFLTPPDLTAPRNYTRVVTINGDYDLVYTSGLYGDATLDAEGQTRSMFEGMKTLIAKAGSDMDHLVRNTSYITGKDASDALDRIRPEYFREGRAPASSKMPVKGVGKSGAVTTLDMIAVVPR